MTKELKILFLQITVILVLMFKILPSLGHKEVPFISDPVQSLVSPGVDREITHKGKRDTYTLEKLASYEISAVVKGKRYYFFDSASQVSPMDLALAWGSLDTEEADDAISYSQSGRWYYFSCDCQSSLDTDYVRRHSANVHIIPKDREVLMKLVGVHKEDYISLKGYLVNVVFPENKWESSLSRDDTGNGACEIMYVESVSINKQ